MFKSILNSANAGAAPPVGCDTVAWYIPSSRPKTEGTTIKHQRLFSLTFAVGGKLNAYFFAFHLNHFRSPQ